MGEEKNILVSIIIPVYNTPKDFFEKCIESIVCTKSPLYEIVVIDDGSKEDNSRYYKEYCSKYEQIVYFKKPNGGVSSARNQGIRMAKGQYVAFVDADDIVTPNFLMDAATLAKKYKSDVVIGAMKYDNMPLEPQGSEKELYLPKQKIISLKKCFLGIPQTEIQYGILGSPCGKLYKRNMVLKIMFSEKMTHLEDQLFNRKFIDIIQTAVLVPNLWYIYNQNDFSAMHNVTPGKYLEKLTGFFEEWESMNEQEEKEIRVGARVSSILFFYIAANDIVADESIFFIERIRKLRNLYSYKIFSNLVQEPPLKCNISRAETFKLFLIKHKMIYSIYAFVYIRRKMRKLAGTL